jgi:hypothetical protein
MYQTAHGKPCPYCRRIMRVSARLEERPTRDHLIPRPQRRVGEPSVIVMVCYRCNHNRGNLTLEQWLERLDSAGDDRALHVSSFLRGERLQRVLKRASKEKFSGIIFSD